MYWVWCCVAIYLNQKHSGCKKSCSQELKHGYAEKDVKSKMGGQGQHSDSVDRNKILIVTIQATKCLAILITFCGLNCNY